MSLYNHSFNNEFPLNKNKFFRSQNFSKSISIDNIQFKQKKIRVNSPITLKAMKQLGYKSSDLEYLPFKEYIRKNPYLIGKTKDSQEKIYSQIEKLRGIRFRRIKELRYKLKTLNNSQDENSRYKSSYRLRKRAPPKMDNVLSNSIDNYCSSALEREKQILERIKNKKENQFFSKIQFELQKELTRKKNENKLNIQKIKYQNYQLEQSKKKLEEEMIKLQKENEIKKIKEENELMEKKLIKKIYNSAIKKAKDEEALQIIRQKELEIKHLEEENRYSFFQKKLQERLEGKKLKILERAKLLEMKEKQKRKQIEQKNKEQQELNLRKSLEKKAQIEQNLKNYQKNQEEIRKKYETKKRENEEKEKRLEQLAKKENEIKIANSKKKEEKRKLILEESKQKIKDKINKFNNKQKNFQIHLDQIERNNELKKLEKLQLKEEKEQKIRDTLKKSKEILAERKEKIQHKIHLSLEHQKSVMRKNQIINEKKEEINLGKQIEKEFKVKEMAQQKLNMINDAKIKMYERDKKIEHFLEQKNLINEQKRIISDEINKQKQIYSERVHNVFGKDKINQKELTQFKNIFSNSPKISGVINKFDELIKK